MCRRSLLRSVPAWPRRVLVVAGVDRQYCFRLQKLLARHTPALQEIGNKHLQGYTVVITGPTRCVA
jgi:hypothetical protein